MFSSNKHNNRHGGGIFGSEKEAKNAGLKISKSTTSILTPTHDKKIQKNNISGWPNKILNFAEDNALMLGTGVGVGYSGYNIYFGEPILFSLTGGLSLAGLTFVGLKYKKSGKLNPLEAVRYYFPGFGTKTWIEKNMIPLSVASGLFFGGTTIYTQGIVGLPVALYGSVITGVFTFFALLAYDCGTIDPIKLSECLTKKLAEGLWGGFKKIADERNKQQGKLRKSCVGDSTGVAGWFKTVECTVVTTLFT